MVAPFNNGKWGLFVDPMYQTYKSEFKVEFGRRTAEYASIEIPIGIRHYFLLNDKSNLFINANYVLDYVFSSTVTIPGREDLNGGSGTNRAVGLGYKYDNTFSLEFRYGLSRNILKEVYLWTSDYTSASFIIGYTVW